MAANGGDNWTARMKLSSADLDEMRRKAEQAVRDGYHATTRAIATGEGKARELLGDTEQGIDKFKAGVQGEMDRMMGKLAGPSAPAPEPKLRGTIKSGVEPASPANFADATKALYGQQPKGCVGLPVPDHTSINHANHTIHQGDGGFASPRVRGDGTPGSHQGWDFTAPIGTGIRAAADGRVTISTPDASTYGRLIEIDHGDGLKTRYAHGSSAIVRVGDQVRAGDVIGQTGASGNAADVVRKGGDPHLHWEVRQDGRPVDPSTRLCPNWSASFDLPAKR